MRLVLSLVVFVLVGYPVNAQSRVDSLLNFIETTADDSSKTIAYITLYYEYHRVDAQIALEYATKAELLAEETNLTWTLGRAKFRKGSVLTQLGEFRKAEHTLNGAFEIFEKLQDKKYMGMVKIQQALLQKDQSNLEAATELYITALKLTQEISDRNSEARIYNYLGSVYNTQKQPLKAIEQFEKALQIVTEIDFKPGISACMVNLGQMYSQIGEFDKAINILEEALKLKKETNDRLGEGRLLGNLANLHSEMASYDLANQYYSTALVIAKEVNNADLITTLKYGLAKNAFERRDYINSINKAQSLINDTLSADNLDVLQKTHLLLAHSFKEIGKFDSAYYNAILSKTLSDSLYNDRITTIINDLEAKYQNEQKSKNIAALESENELQQVQIDNRLRERNYLIVAIILVLLLAGLTYNQYKIKQRANAKLEELDHLKSEFFANVSHEFRTPLSLIMAPLKDKIASTSTDRELYILMYRNAENLYTLINQLLDISKLEHGALKIDRREIEVFSFLRIVTASFDSLAVHRKINFLAIIPDQECKIKLDEDVLKKICNNLLSNAFKFTPEHGRIEFKVMIADQNLSIIISDSGAGIPERDQSKVFDRFYQSSAQGQLGTGIGLALTKQLVEIHGGKISLQSSEEGTSFKVQIPVGQATISEIQSVSDLIEDQLTTLSPEQGENKEAASANGPIVLIIEDNYDLRTYLKGLLRNNFEVHESSNGIEGLAKAKEIIPDLVLSDVMMPGKGGVEVCHELKQSVETQHIPIVLLTALTDQSSRLEGLYTGADDYLSKPFDPEELLVRISNLLDQRTLLKEKYSKLLLLEPSKMEVTDRDEIFIKKLLDIVNAEIDNSEFTVEELSKEVGMSRMQLHRKLTALTGHSSSTFIRHIRLSKAEKLLQSGESVSQVAYATGFSSPSYFSRAFKEEYGVAPSDYIQNKV